MVYTNNKKGIDFEKIFRKQQVRTLSQYFIQRLQKIEKKIQKNRCFY